MAIQFHHTIDHHQLLYVDALPVAVTGAKVRVIPRDPLRMYALDGDMIMAYIEYTRHGQRIDIKWVANWGIACGHDGLDGMLLRHACSVWDDELVLNVYANVTLRKEDPTWLFASQANLLYDHGFAMKYWARGDDGEIVHRMNRKNRNVN